MSALIIMGCSAAKLVVPAPAVEFYNGAMFQVLRAYMPDPAPDVMVISALYGLLMGHDEVEPYDQRMTTARAAELESEGFPPGFQFDGEPYDRVFVACGGLYRGVARIYVRDMMGFGQITEDASIEYCAGGIGYHRQQLGRFLRSLRVHEVAA